MNLDFQTANTEADIRACFPVMHELRPHLTEDAFVEQAKRQMANHGYRLVAVRKAGEIVAVAGFRVAEYLAWGKLLYVDDLVTASAKRKSGSATALVEWLEAEARRLGCTQLHLDSGVHRHDAHRLYLGCKLDITSHHFAKKLD